MFDYDKWQEIYLTIKRHKLRTALTAFGVFWGIFMLVVLLGAGNGLRNGVEANFDIAKNTVFVWTERTSLPYKGFKPGRWIELDNNDLEAIRNNISEIKVIAPRNSLGGEFQISRNKKSAAFRVMGDYPSFTKVKPMAITKGRFINDIDIDQRRKIAIVGDQVVDQLFEPDEDPIGQYILIRGVNFHIVGIFKSLLRGDDAFRDAQRIYIPNTTMQLVFNQGDAIGWFAFIPQDGIPASVVEQKVKKLLARRHIVHPDDREAFGSENVEEEYLKIQGLFAGIKGFSWLVAIGTIVAGMVGVGNIMMIIVRERTKEIGVRKSLGAQPWSIINMIIQESLVITGLSGYFGLVLGVALIEGINFLLINFDMESEYFANPEIDFHVAVSAILVLLVAGTVAGLIPGIRAAKVNPMLALRDE